jgi:hypothetical protein
MDVRLLIRALRVVLIVAAVAVAAVPLLVIFDLAAGGTGYGLCPDGLTACRNPYRAAPELSITLTLGLMVVLAGLRTTNRAYRRMQRRHVPPHGS